MIKGYCSTKLDNYKFEEWPTEFVVAPQKGDCVQSKSGKFLQVVGITHLIGKIELGDGLFDSGPMIKIELSKQTIF